MLADVNRAVEAQSVLINWADPYSLVCCAETVRVLVPLTSPEVEDFSSALRITEVRAGAGSELVLGDGLGVGAIAAPPVASNWERPKEASVRHSEMVAARCLTAVRIIGGRDGWRTSWGGWRRGNWRTVRSEGADVTR